MATQERFYCTNLLFDITKHINNIYQVTDKDTYIHWLNETFVHQYFFKQYFGSPYSEAAYKGFTTDIANVRVGPARLRQLRISPGRSAAQ